MVGQGPIALAVGAGGGVFDIFPLVFFLSPSPGDGPIYDIDSILSKKAVKSKTINQPTEAIRGGGVATLKLCILFMT